MRVEVHQIRWHFDLDKNVRPCHDLLYLCGILCSPRRRSPRQSFRSIVEKGRMEYGWPLAGPTVRPGCALPPYFSV
jgi:hypothetical protein